MRSATRYLIFTATLGLALLLGVFGLSLLFSDFGPNETSNMRILAAALFFAGSGFLLGLLNPTRWPVAGVVAWGGVLLGIISMLGNVGQLSAFLGSGLLLFGPLLLALAGGYLGQSVRAYRQG